MSSTSDVPRKRCPFCGESIAQTARKCRFCSTDLVDAPNASANGDPKLPLYGLAAAAAVLIGFAVLVSVANRVAGPSEPRWKREDDWHGAYWETQRAVEARLLSPASADFPWRPTKHSCNVDTQTYFIEGYVDSQNGFGAQIRSNFAAILRKTGEETWVVDKVAID